MSEDLIKIDETFIYKAKKGFLVYEFFRLGKEESYMEDNVEVFKYDSRQKSKGKKSLILVKDMPSWIKMVEEMGFERIS